MDESDYMIEKKDHMELVICHVFLTRQLPQKAECSSLHGMLVRFTYNYMPTMKMPMLGLQSVRETMEMWADTQSACVNEFELSKALHALQPGQTFAIFVRAHNSVITIKRSETELNNALMSVFRVSANNEMVMTEGDLFQTFPERAVWVPFNRFLLEAFAIQVAILCNETFEQTIPIKEKAGDAQLDIFDVAEPFFVLSWLLGAMSGTLKGDNNFVCVDKVIRDDVFCNSELENPWRRSGEWFAVKCVLQIMLVTELGSVEGTIVYKSMMLYIMIGFLDNLPWSYGDNDVIMQMLSKVSRRMAKLSNRISGKNNFDIVNEGILSKETNQWIKIVFLKAHDVLKIKRTEADVRWSKHMKMCCESLLNISGLRANDHLTHKLNQKAVTRLKQAFEERKNPGLYVSSPPYVNRWNNVNTLFDIYFLKSAIQYSHFEENLWDFEVWVRNTLWANNKINTPHFVEYNTQIFDLLFIYFEISLSFYKNDPVGSSRMIITVLLITAGLDSIAVMEWPLLSEYHSSFEDSYFDSLLVPLIQDMKHLQAVRTYFINRNIQSKLPCIMLEYNVNSIGYRIANQNQQMQLKKKEILLYALQQRENKRKEFEIEKKRYDDLVQKSYNETHEKNARGRCYRSCYRCQLNKIIKSIKIDVYEDPIPEDSIIKQNAIIFELSIPVRIRCLRDSLFLVHKRLSKNQFDEIKIRNPWKSHTQLSKWISSECQKSLVSIGSTTDIINIVSPVTCDSSSHSFLAPCRHTINLYMQHKQKKCKMNMPIVKQLKHKFCTMKAWRNPFEIDVKWVSETTHTENEVLASQYQCSLNIKLDEFKVFGSLRAGHRLQLRKILLAFEMHSLSFEHSSVFALVAQALWQAGPVIKKTVNDPALFFESHADLRNDGFCLVLIDCLSKFLENTSKNWKKHSQLQLVIILVLRMFSLSSNKIRFEVTTLLMRCRCIAQIWANEIENLLSSMMTSNLNEIHEVRLKLIDVAAFTALTFDVDGHFESILDKDTLCTWLHAVARIHDNFLLIKDSPDIERINLLRRVKLIGLRIQNTSIKILALHSNEIFHNFLSLEWPDFSKVTCKDIWVQDNQEWYSNDFYTTSNRSIKLQINILSGKFLVNGNPIGRLPEIITKSPDYERVFGHHVFEVRPAAETFNSFVTVNMLQGISFTFSYGKHGLVVVERRSSGDEYELIPHTIFSEQFPCHFIINYSHWLCKRTNTLFFRPVKFENIHFSKEDSDRVICYKFDVQHGTLYDLKRKRYLIDIQSETFERLYNFSGIKRLELKDHIHLWLNNKETAEIEEYELKLNVELPRMDLCFKYEDKNGKLFSREYVGMIVSQLQGDLGTLIGLENGLLLCEDKPIVKNDFPGLQKVLILPHSKDIKLNKSNTSNHQMVKIKLKELLSPPYFAYSIDDRLCELRGPAIQQAWLYLSKLHAMTSSSLPDPFTRLTGTESAMRLLQIGRTFSCKPLEQNEVNSLKSISKLAPKRKLYPKVFVHSVIWEPKLGSSYAYDGLVLTAKILQNRAAVYKEFYMKPINESKTKKKKKPNKNMLNKRAYWRYRSLFNSCARLNSESEKNLGGLPTRQLAWKYTSDDKFNDCIRFNLNDSRLLMENYYQWNGVHYSPSNLWDIVEKKMTLEDSNDSNDFSSLILSNQSLIDRYLFLYKLAQQVNKEMFCRFKFSLLLSFLAFKGENKDLLYSLFAVSILGIDIEAPVKRNFDHLNETDFNLKAIHSVVEEETLSFDRYLINQNKNNTRDMNLIDRDKIKALYESSKTNALATLGEIARSQWSSRRVNVNLKCNDIVNIYNLELEINKLFIRWDNNGKLKTFFNEVEMSIRMKQLNINRQRRLNILFVPSFSNPKTSIKSQEPYDLKIAITSLPENQDAGNLFRNKSSSMHNKTCGNTVKRKVYSEEILSLFDIPDNNNDALFEFMRNSIETSCKELSKNDLFSLEENGFENDIFDEFHKCLLENNQKSISWWGEVSAAMKPQTDDVVGCSLYYGGLWRRVTPVVVVPCILPLSSFYRTLLLLDSNDSVPKSIVDRVGALIVSWTAEQKAIRCLKMHRNKSPPAILSREINNKGHENWIPSSYPEWLILELEGNFLIRPIQISIAQSMLNAKENFVQQLNMGEGKTSIIVPLLAVSLATSEQLARVTVLRSLLNTNYDALVEKLGGVLNKRVYVIPCRRDMILDPLKVSSIYQECLHERGLVLTTPEYRLSLDLKTLEHCRENTDDSRQLFELRCWLRKHARDILDETDEILNVKYQVVYTLGDQLLVDGGELRWIIPQAVLRLVNKFAKDLPQLFGKEYIEYYDRKTHFADSFSHIRLLSNNAVMYKHLCGLIADSILNNEIPEVSVAAKLEQRDKITAKLFITTNEIFPQMRRRLSELFEINPILKEELLILRGLLCFEVLHTALQKRWRVHFGVNFKGTISKMAVPFRAKDVAAERTEFGHPDMAIILTQVSYYMSGLNDDQLDEVFKYLDKCSYKDTEYERWIEAIGIANVTKDLHVLNGVNLDNVEQKCNLYSLLRYSMNVVNFWLNRAVYPREAKQFPYRISTSAWDLCLSNDTYCNGIEKCTTGFSGTNESELLLPLTIKSNDLSQTQGTNAMVLSYLLQSENNTYYHYDSITETLDESVLNIMEQIGARVLIDVGALMLQMDNKNVCLELLKKYDNDLKVSAAVYFDKDDRLMAIDRKGCICSLSISPYLHQLDRCVFYIDDIHTRGTDLKFPFNTLACVTLGKGLTKDRLIQACMRMRLLGNGHRVFFYAATDVHLSIKKQMKICSEIPNTVDVLRWAINNSCNSIRDGLLHWSSQGLRRATKEAAESLMYNRQSKKIVTHNDLKELGTMCTEDETIFLSNFYGESRRLESVSNIFKKSLANRVELFNKCNGSKVFSEIIISTGDGIFSRCNKFVSTYKCFSNILDEEQERELEAELEEECHIERPGAQSPHIPRLSQEVKDLVKKGVLSDNNEEILPIDSIFSKTNRLSKLFPKGCWNPALMVTKEFTMVIKDYKEGDNFLFEISWLILVPPKTHFDYTRYILVSSFEVNELLPKFRSVQKCAVKLYMFAPRLRRGQNIFIHQNSLILPEYKSALFDDHLIAQLFVLGGGLFFLTDAEQDAYCNFLGLLKDYSDNASVLYSKTTEIKLLQSDSLEYKIPIDICKLNENCVNFAIEILRKRDRCVQTTASHVCQLLFHGVRSSIGITEITVVAEKPVAKKVLCEY